MKYIKSYKIFESVVQAKSILKSLKKDINDDSYLKIREILKGHDGYVGWFTNLHYKLGYELNDLLDLWNLIKSNMSYVSKLPQPLIKYDNIEKVYDDLEIVKSESSYNRILGEFPNKQRSFLNDSDKELLQNLSKRKDNKSFFKKVSSYQNRNQMIEAIKNFLSIDPNSNLDKVMKMSEESGSDIVYYSFEDDILIVRVYNTKQLNKIAADCSWCIKSDSMFQSYVNRESKQFIIFLFDRIDRLSRIGVTSRLTEKNFYHTAHDKLDRRVSYEDLKEILNKYDVDPYDFMKFSLSDINIDNTSVKRLIDTFNLDKKEIIKLKGRFRPDDISMFTKDEIEKWNLLEKSEINYGTLVKYTWDEVISKNLIRRLSTLSISDIVNLYDVYGYKVIEYIKNNLDILNSLSGVIPYRSKEDDLTFFKREVLNGKLPSVYNFEVGNYWNDTGEGYNYSRTVFRLLWFKDDLKKMISKDERVIKRILDIRDFGTDLVKFLKDLDIDLDHIKHMMEYMSFDFNNWVSLIDLYKQSNRKYDHIVSFLYDKIKKYRISDYELESYKKSGIFSDKQIEKLEYSKSFKEFLISMPDRPYSRDMTKSYSEKFYNDWKDKFNIYIKDIISGNGIMSRGDNISSLLLVFTKLDKLDELEKYDFKLVGHGGSGVVRELSEVMSGIYNTNGGVREPLTEEECKKLYTFLTKKCDLSDLNLLKYSVEGKTIEARDGDSRYHYLPSMYLYDRNEFENYLVYEVSNLKYNLKNSDVFVPVPGDKTKNTTNRVAAVQCMFSFFMESKKTDVSEFEDFINTLISFDLSLSEVKYLIDNFTYYRYELSKNIKKMLLSELKRKTKSEKILSKYSKILL